MTAPGHERDIYGEPQQEAFPLLEYLQVLWFRRRLVIAITLFAAIIGFIHVNELKNVYTATSSLMIGVPSARVVNIDQVLSRDFVGNEAEAEMEVLRSRGLAQKVIERLNLLSYAEFNPDLAVPEERFFDFLETLNPKRWIPAAWKQAVKEAIRGEVAAPAPALPGGPSDEEEKEIQKMVRAVNIFLSKLGASRVSYTNVVVVRFSSLDPKLAARVANEIPEAYIDDQLQAKLDATRKATQWLTEQLEQQKQKVAESERAVVIFRESRGLTERLGNDLAGQRITEFNSQLIVARAQRLDLEARLRQVNQVLENDLQGLDAAPELMASASIQQLRGNQTEAQRRARELGLVFGPKHPRMLQAQAELDDIARRTRTAIENIALNLANELELTRTEIQNLERRLADAEAQSGMQNREAIQLRALEREAAADRALFETFLGRFKETSSTEELQSSDARVISAAVVPSGPSYPNRQRTFLVFLMGGFMLGCALVFTLHAMHPGMLAPEELERELGIHNLGLLPLLPSGKPPYRHVQANKTSAFIEALNSLKISLQLSDPDERLKVLQITSSVPGEGKSTLAATLAHAMAQGEKRVLLVDADLRQSGIEHKLGIEADAPGLTDLVITPDGRLEDHVISSAEGGFDLMRSGDARQANAADLFNSNRMAQIVTMMREHYDFVIIDAPPVMSFADARVIGQLADKTLFVVRWDKTPRKVIKAAVQTLKTSGISIVGSVLQQVNLGRYGRLGYGNSGYYYHYGHYGRYYQE